NSMPLRNLVFVDSVASSYAIRPSPRRCLTGKLHNGSLLIDIPDCLKPYFSAIGSIESAVPPDASSQASGVNDLWYFFCTRFDAISRFPTLFSDRCSPSSLKRPFCSLQLAHGFLVSPLCPPCRITSNRSAQFLLRLMLFPHPAALPPCCVRRTSPSEQQHPRAQPQFGEVPQVRWKLNRLSWPSNYTHTFRARDVSQAVRVPRGACR